MEDEKHNEVIAILVASDEKLYYEQTLWLEDRELHNFLSIVFGLLVDIWMMYRVTIPESLLWFIAIWKIYWIKKISNGKRKSNEMLLFVLK